jgi:phage shock protein PspC (stress-responsive transcriptional regulator)
MIWGVCGGLAEYFKVDPTIVRLITVLTIFLSGFGIIAYIILAVVVPLESSATTQPKETIRENVQEMKETAIAIGKEFQSTFSKEDTAGSKSTGSYHRSISVLGIVIIIIGIIFLIATLTNFWGWFSWAFVWPVILIIIGLLIIFSRRK